jgi:hypothetical protein
VEILRIPAECELVEETMVTLEHDGNPLPQPLSGRDFLHLMQRSA